jgi:hypothetical protein
MKKIVLVLIVGMFLCSGLAAAVQNKATTTSQTMTRTFSPPALTTDNTYTQVSIAGTNDFLLAQGQPMLPMYKETFTYPFGTRINTVTVTPSSVHTTAVPTLVEPTPPIAGANILPPTQTTAVSYGADPYPSIWFSYNVGCGLYDSVDQVIVTVEVYPVKYLSAQNVLQWTPSADITIQTTPAQPQSHAGRDSYQLVIITPTEYSSALSTLVSQKISRGISTKLVTLTEITGGTYFPVTGRDDAEKVKYFIKNAIETWSTTSVLLVGGIDKLPSRETHVYIADDPEYGDEIFTTDLYFADIYNATGVFSSWDTNNNNLFGEYNWNGLYDTVDLHPDVFLTRLPVTESSQVGTLVNKIIGYETTPGYQQSWFPAITVCGGDSFPDDNIVNEGEYANQKVIDLMTSFTATKLWVTNGKLTGFAPNGVQVIKDTINSGCGFVDFSGHGATYIWATHPTNNFNVWVPTPLGGFDTSDIAALSNGNKLPIITVEACSTAKYYEDAACFNWAFLYATNGGAIGSFGATGIGYSYIGTGVTTGLVGKIGLDTFRAYKTDHAVTFGDMYVRAMNRYIKTSMNDGDYKTVEEWQPFGDPTLAIAEASQPPAKPSTPSGQAQGTAGNEYSYSTHTTDPEGDKVYYMFDWGDGTKSSWLGPYNSGATASASKTWAKKGTYSVKVIAKDTHASLSIWSDPTNVTMPYIPNRPLLNFLQHLLDLFPNGFPFLRHLLGY